MFRKLTKRKPLTKPPRELWLGVGRRGGKDYVAARVAIFLALLCKWKLAVGETGVVLLLAVDREQARIAFRYVRGALEANDVLQAEVSDVLSDRFVLRNGIEIVIGTSDHASVRGRTVLAAILDEAAFWGDEQLQEVLRALRPAMLTQPQAMLIVISSVYAQRGEFYETYRRSYGVNDPRVLFALATTIDMNPTVDAGFIEAEIEKDPAAASAEYMSIFRSDLELFIDAALLDSCTRTEPRELPRRPVSPTGQLSPHYFGGVDVSGGRGDAAAAAVSHRDGDKVIVDACRAWPAPHDPLIVAKEIAAFFATYGIKSATADAYAAEFATSAYREAGIALIPAEVNRSEAYLYLLPLLTSGRVELPPEPKLRRELLALERKTGRGKDIVDHPPHGHDDLANSVALTADAASRVATGAPQMPTIVIGGGAKAIAAFRLRDSFY